MKRIGQRMFRESYFLVFFTILVLCSLFVNRGESQIVPLQNESKKEHPKIEGVLTQLLEEHTTGGFAASQGFASDHGIKLDQEGMITVFLLPQAGKTKETIDIEALKGYGGEIIKSGDHIIKAKVPISMLKEIAENVKGISFIKLPDKPHANVISEGVSLIGASTYHSAGYTGGNVKVAVIDLGFEGLSNAISSGELPSSVIPLDCTGADCVTTDFSSEGEVHGTAVAEIVYDMAPSAQLYLIKVGDRLDLKSAKDYCIANGIEVINHSVAWFNTNFYDGSCYNDNPICTVNNSYSNGILWVNSVGNYAKQHYEAIFNPDAHNFHSEDISFSALAGDTIKVYLTWNAWPATDQDYDLYLLDSSLNIIKTSENRQTGTQEPNEQIIYTASVSGQYHVRIYKYGTTSNHKFEIFTLDHDLFSPTLTSSLASPADSAYAMAVAAIDWNNWALGPQEDYSSQGPTTDGRTKPDISGPDGVSTLTYGHEGCFGTSAAAPHVAGAAALILSKNPSYNALQVWNSLTCFAIDMGTPNIYGWGRLNLLQSTLNYTLDISNTGNGSVKVNGTSQTLPWSAWFASCSVVQLQAIPDLGYTFSSWNGVDSSSSTTAYVTMNGNRTVTASFIQAIGPGPDLTGEWWTGEYLSPSQSCKNTRKGQKCTIKGTLKVKNIGNKDSTPTIVDFYLSDDGVTYQETERFKRVSVSKIKAVLGYKLIKLSYTLLLGESASGKYVIAVINPLDSEIDKTNNVIPYGPIQ